ncbi:MAG: ribose-phosphate pyrophosphokinase, partial [Bacteroidaceae bacterium]|nr:ribose-phosphate pyrophosphokinase [Bacteroidaceae bacterium]
IMSGNASERVRESALTEIVFTNSIPYERSCPKIKQLSVANIFAAAIKCVLNNESISQQYIC